MTNIKHPPLAADLRAAGLINEFGAQRSQQMTTTWITYSDARDAGEIASDPRTTDEERTAAAHILASYDLRTDCEREHQVTVQSAGKRLRLW